MIEPDEFDDWGDEYEPGPESGISVVQICHIVFSTKDRRPVIGEEFQAPLHECIAGITLQCDGLAFAINGTANHVHILAKLSPDRSIDEYITNVKSRSADWLRREVPNPIDFTWDDGYGAFSVSESEVESISRYIDGQRISHQTLSYEDEYIALLNEHEIEFDRDTLWD